MGAIVTCPLEVVKTRLQSSRSCFAQNIVMPNIAQENGGPQKTTCQTVPPVQRRRLWTSSHSCRPQVVALSGYVAASKDQQPRPNQSMSLFQCLRHIIKYEGPMALFKGMFKATFFFVYRNCSFTVSIHKKMGVANEDRLRTTALEDENKYESYKRCKKSIPHIWEKAVRREEILRFH